MYVNEQIDNHTQTADFCLSIKRPRHALLLTSPDKQCNSRKANWEQFQPEKTEYLNHFWFISSTRMPSCWEVPNLCSGLLYAFNDFQCIKQAMCKFGTAFGGPSLSVMFGGRSSRLMRCLFLSTTTVKQSLYILVWCSPAVLITPKTLYFNHHLVLQQLFTKVQAAQIHYDQWSSYMKMGKDTWS